MGGITRLGYMDVLVVREIGCGGWFSPRIRKPKNIVNCFTLSLGMCLGMPLVMPLGMLLSPGPGQFLRSYVVNQALTIHLVQRLKGIVH